MPTIELIMDNKGRCAGGYGRLYIRGFDTTNHYGATGDGLVMAYRAGAKLLYMDSVRYHPTGAVFPEQIAGFLITEKIRIRMPQARPGVRT